MAICVVSTSCLLQIRLLWIRVCKQWMRSHSLIQHEICLLLNWPHKELTTRSAAYRLGFSGLDTTASYPSPPVHFLSGPAPLGVCWCWALRPSPGKPGPPGGTSSTSGGKKQRGHHLDFLHSDGSSPGPFGYQHKPTRVTKATEKDKTLWSPARGVLSNKTKK